MQLQNWMTESAYQSSLGLYTMITVTTSNGWCNLTILTGYCPAIQYFDIKFPDINLRGNSHGDGIWTTQNNRLWTLCLNLETKRCTIDDGSSCLIWFNSTPFMMFIVYPWLTRISLLNSHFLVPPWLQTPGDWSQDRLWLSRPARAAVCIAPSQSFSCNRFFTIQNNMHHYQLFPFNRC